MNKEERKKYIFAQLRSLPNATQYVEVTKYFEDLEQQCRKQKEVINKINEFIKELYDNTDDTTCYDIDKIIKEELLDILKEVLE